MGAKTAVGLLLAALFVVVLAQLLRRRPEASDAARTISVAEIGSRLEPVKSKYSGADREAMARELDRFLSSLRAKYGEQVRAVDALKLLRELPLPSGDLVTALLAPTPPGASAVPGEAPPDGVSVEWTPEGFVLHASCRSLVTGVLWVGFAVLLGIIPFRLWGDLIRGVWTDEGLSFWLTSAFLAIWAGGVLYTGWMGALGLFGEIRIAKAADRGEIFTGIGPAGWTHRLQWSEFHNAANREVSRVSSTRFSRTVQCIGLAGPSTSYVFGSELEAPQRTFVIAFLRRHVFGSGLAGRTAAAP